MSNEGKNRNGPRNGIARAVAGLAQEWIFQLALLAAVVVALLDGVASLSPGQFV